MLPIVGYICAIFIGIILGLIGGGGSILTVPVLVYVFQLHPVPASAYSLFIVGITAFSGSVSYMKKGFVDYRTGIVFAIPSLVAVYLTRKFLVPALPDVIFETSRFILSKGVFIMTVFGFLMIATSMSMIQKIKVPEENNQRGFVIPYLVLEGAVVGVLTGFVGAGGGFLIIPALVLFARLPMKTAIGTSLLIIAIKSLFGFLGDVGGEYVIDFPFLIVFSILSTTGIILGSLMAKAISGKKLRPVFGWFVLAMGIYIIIKEWFIDPLYI